MIRVLESQEQIQASRRRLNELGVDTSRGLSRRLFQLLFALRFRRLPGPVAVNKSWDVLTMLETIQEHFPDKASRIYDMGSFNCEIPLALWRRGYRDIRAADLNPLGRCIRWYGNRIDFHCEDFYLSLIHI